MNKREYAKALSAYPTALTVKEVSEILRVSTKTIYKLIGRGELPAIKIGRENRVSKEILISYLRRNSFESTNLNYILSDNSRNIVWTSDGACDIVALPKGKYQMRG